MTERLFFALWPDEDVRERIAAQLPAMPKPARPVQRANWHVTLAFLGEVDAARRRAHEEAAAALAGKPFDLRLDRFGYFHRPKVLWLGATGIPEALRAAHAGLNSALAEQGFEPDSRPFTVHLTLARRMPPPGELPEPEPVPWHVTDFSLVRSELSRAGARYAVLRRFPLRGA